MQEVNSNFETRVAHLTDETYFLKEGGGKKGTRGQGIGQKGFLRG